MISLILNFIMNAPFSLHPSWPFLRCSCGIMGKTDRLWDEALMRGLGCHHRCCSGSACISVQPRRQGWLCSSGQEAKPICVSSFISALNWLGLNGWTSQVPALWFYPKINANIGVVPAKVRDCFSSLGSPLGAQPLHDYKNNWAISL